MGYERAWLGMSDKQADENKQLVDDMYAGLNKNTLGLMSQFWHEDMVWDGPAGIGVRQGIEDFEENYRKAFIHAFPDKHAEDVVHHWFPYPRNPMTNWLAH